MYILVIRGGAIGDFILTLPVFQSLRQLTPQPRIEILGYPKTASLALAGNLADQVHSIESIDFTPFFVREGDLGESARCFFSRFELIVSFLFDPDRIFETNVARCTSATFLKGPHRPVPGQGHAVRQLLQPLEEHGIRPVSLVPDLKVLALPEERQLADRWLAVHPGSGSVSKNWPPEKWLQLLINLAAQTKWNFLLIGGEAEGERLEQLARNLPKNRLRTAFNLPLPDLAQEMSRCQFFIGHDSGITHLAAALDLPGLVFWGATDEEVWKPANSSMTILRNLKGINEIPVEEPLRILEEL